MNYGVNMFSVHGVLKSYTTHFSSSIFLASIICLRSPVSYHPQDKYPAFIDLPLCTNKQSPTSLPWLKDERNAFSSNNLHIRSYNLGKALVSVIMHSPLFMTLLVKNKGFQIYLHIITTVILSSTITPLNQPLFRLS